MLILGGMCLSACAGSSENTVSPASTIDLKTNTKITPTTSVNDFALINTVGSLSQLSVSNNTGLTKNIITYGTPGVTRTSQTIEQQLQATSSAKGTSISVSMPQNWNIGWLQGIPCRLPCWERITPNQSGLDEAIQLFKQNPLIDNKSIKVSEPPQTQPPDFIGNVIFNWQDARRAVYARYTTKTTKRIITSITVFYYNTFKLKDIIDAYGEPTHVEALLIPNNGIHYSIRFYWLSQGLSVGPPSSSKSYNLSADMPISDSDGAIQLLGIQHAEELNGLNGGKSYFLVPWQGYKDFAFYCRNYLDGTPCNPVK